jgi:hypothetical protein
MGQPVVYNHQVGSAKSSISSGSGGGDVEDILRRLGNVEASVSDLRMQVGAIGAAIPGLATAASVSRIEAVLPHLATAVSVEALRTQVGAIAATMPGLATAASVSRIEAVLPHLATAASVSRIEAIIPTLATKADLSDMHAATIKWIVATALTSTGLATTLAFSIAKFVH